MFWLRADIFFIVDAKENDILFFLWKLTTVSKLVWYNRKWNKSSKGNEKVLCGGCGGIKWFVVWAHVMLKRHFYQACSSFYRLFMEILNSCSDCDEIQFKEDGSWAPMRSKKQVQEVSAPYYGVDNGAYVLPRFPTCVYSLCTIQT